MSKSMKNRIELAIRAARRMDKPKDYTACPLIAAEILKYIGTDFKVLVQTDAECGFNVTVWSPKGRIINSDHRSGYWVIL